MRPKKIRAAEKTCFVSAAACIVSNINFYLGCLKNILRFIKIKKNMRQNTQPELRICHTLFDYYTLFLRILQTKI